MSRSASRTSLRNNSSAKYQLREIAAGSRRPLLASPGEGVFAGREEERRIPPSTRSASFSWQAAPRSRFKSRKTLSRRVRSIGWSSTSPMEIAGSPRTTPPPWSSESGPEEPGMPPIRCYRGSFCQGLDLPQPLALGQQSFADTFRALGQDAQGGFLIDPTFDDSRAAKANSSKPTSARWLHHSLRKLTGKYHPRPRFINGSATVRPFMQGSSSWVSRADASFSSSPVSSFVPPSFPPSALAAAAPRARNSPFPAWPDSPRR